MATGNIAVSDVDYPVPSIPEGRRLRDLLELSFGYALILLVIWTRSPWQRPLYCTAAAFILAVSWKSFDSWQAMRPLFCIRSGCVLSDALSE